MAPLPENNTDRFWLDYTDGQNEHSLQVRYDGATATVEAAMSSVHFFLLDMAPALYTLTVNGARASTAGSLVSVPVTWAGDATYGLGAMPAALAPRQVCFLGRDGSGRRVRWFLFGWNAPTPSAYRVGITAGTPFGDALATIIAHQALGTWLTIAGFVPTMYTYVDVNYNSYWEAESR